MDYYFPYSEVRNEQDKLLEAVNNAIMYKKNLLCHAPTGLGKTVAVLGPAIKQAMDHNLRILFLTSRYTQHKIALETIREIKDKYDLKFSAISIVGKKWMCSQPGVNNLHSSEFFEFCKSIREDKKCEYYNNLRTNKLTVRAQKLKEQVMPLLPLSSEEIIDHCANDKICPYYFSMLLATECNCIIGDYYYLFHPKIQETLFAKAGLVLEDTIVIVDEAHNLGNRLKDLASEFLSSNMVKRAIKEAKKFSQHDIIPELSSIQENLLKLSDGLAIGKEKLVSKHDFSFDFYDQVAEEFKRIGDDIRETQKFSSIGSVGNFLEAWPKQDVGFARIINHKKGLRDSVTTLNYKCLDPAIVARETINNTHSTILISGTLLPTAMHREVLGISNSNEMVFSDPFPKKNRLNIIIPKTTTKYSRRNPQMYTEISNIISDIANIVPGNSAVFFPSYAIMNQVAPKIQRFCNKTIFTEDPAMLKSDRVELLKSFSAFKDSGACLLAVASGSFGEGIDLPGDLLKAVVVVGLPLNPPDLEAKSLIDYYDKKFGKGWDYGYLFPAFNKCLQSAGRCIRSETDRGVVIFLDERYIWNNYKRCFPNDWELKVSLDYKRLIAEFFRI